MNRRFSNETKEKNMTFRELLKIFEKNKGTDIKLKKNIIMINIQFKFMLVDLKEIWL